MVVLEVPAKGFGVEVLGLLRMNNVDPKSLKRDQRIHTTNNINCRNQDPADRAIGEVCRHDDGADETREVWNVEQRLRIEDQERFDDYGFKIHLLSLPFCTFHLPPLLPFLVVNYHAIPPRFKDKSKLKKRGTERVGDGALHGKAASSRVKPLPDSQLPLIGLLGSI